MVLMNLLGSTYYLRTKFPDPQIGVSLFGFYITIRVCKMTMQHPSLIKIDFPLQLHRVCSCVVKVSLALTNPKPFKTGSEPLFRSIFFPAPIQLKLLHMIERPCQFLSGL